MRLSYAFLLLAAAAVPASAQERPEKPEYTITVSGEAVVAAVPDKAIVSLTVQGKPAKERREAEESHSLVVKGLMDALRAAGVNERDIKSQYYQVQEYYEQKDGRNERKGFFGNQSFQVRIPRERVSTVLDAVPDFANVNGVSYYVSNSRQLRDEATNAAIDDAKARAKARAERLGITLGPIIGYQESGLGRPQPMARSMRAGLAADMAESAPEVPAGEEELLAGVTITYRINVP